MIAAWGSALVGLAGLVSSVGGGFSWPGALEIDGRALATLPGPDRPAAAERLAARHGVAAAAPYLAPLLADPEPEVRAYVGRRLARAGDPRAEAAALGWLTASGRTLVDKTLALDVLSRAPSLSAPARAAIEQAVRDRDAMIRLAALEALGRHEVAPSLAAVLGALDDDSRDVRQQAIALVAAAAGEDRAGAARATLPLVERLEDGDHGIRLAALRALGRLGDPRAVPALLRVTAEQPIDLREAAVAVLAAPSMTAAVPTLVGLARRPPPDELARHAQLALGEIATPPAIAALVEALRRPPVAEETKLGLLAAGPAAVEALAAEVAHGPPSSGARAALLLGQLGDRRATPTLAAAIDTRDGDPALWLVALEALGRLKDPGSFPALARAAEAPQADVRLGAFAALQALGDPRGLVVVDAGLGDPDPHVRTAAVRLAVALDPGCASGGRLARPLADVDPAVRLAAAEATIRCAETVPTRGGAARLDAALVAARGEPTPAFLELLAAAHAQEALPLEDHAVIARVLELVAAGGPSAAAAADVLAAAGLSDAEAAALARAFPESAPTVRARLCAAIARAPGGGEWLTALIAATAEPAEVRAAAAWAARDVPSARATLELAAREPAGPLARNARAALAAGGRQNGAWSALRLLGTGGAPRGGRWVTLSSPGIEVDVRTDDTGVARLEGLPRDAVWRAPGLSLRARP
jgi:HEAT repeat protein